MTLLALALIFVAAFMHATWNYLTKRIGGGAVSVWLYNALATVIYAPIVAVVIVVARPHLGPAQALVMVASSLLHLAYFVALQRGYRLGDLSVVYPLARGTGPLLATAAAIAFLGERPAPIAVAGALLILGGAVLLAGSAHALKGPGKRAAIGYGLLTGLLIAAYTLNDKQAVSTLALPPLLLDWTSQTGLVVLLTPHALRRRDQARALWRAHPRALLGIAVLAPLAYVLVLSALVFTPVSYVAPAREISILIGAAMGARLLAEGQTRRRVVASGAMVLGIVALVVR